jgi:hypothetical protein
MALHRLVFVSILFAAAMAPAAPPTVPASLPYQALLLDGLGQPRTGSVDLIVRIYDALVGGTLVYKQSFPSIVLSDGVFNVQLGPSGESTDAPANPLTTDLATALGGDAGATAPVRFVELMVGGDGPIARTQILASAYALRAVSAASADTAATAATATTATNATNLGGRAAGFFDQFFANTNLDNDGPGNDDPREGLLDSDGDGIANFLETDNDDDAVADSTEIAQGADINLATPRATSATPNGFYFSDTGNVTVHGTGFRPGLSVAFGSQNPTPANVTTTSFDVTVGPQLAGAAAVTVTNANGQSTFTNTIFTFLSSLAHSVQLGARQTTLALKPNSTTLALGGTKQYGVGPVANAIFSLTSKGTNGQIGMSWSPSGALAALRCRDLGTFCVVEILVDSNDDQALETETGIGIESVTTGTPQLLAADLILDPSNHWLAGYVRRTFAPAAVVAHDRNGDGLFTGTNEITVVEDAIASSGPVAADVAVDPSGRAADANVTGGALVHFAWDRNDDGDFADTIGGNPEVTTLSTLGSSCIGATFDGSGHPVVVYSSGTTVYLARDLDDDGDFSSAGETVSVAPGSASGCDVAYKPGQPLAVAYTAPLVHLLLDRNADGDFADANENIPFDKNGGAELELALNGTDRAIVAVSGFLLLQQTN